MRKDWMTTHMPRPPLLGLMRLAFASQGTPPGAASVHLQIRCWPERGAVEVEERGVVSNHLLLACNETPFASRPQLD